MLDADQRTTIENTNISTPDSFDLVVIGAGVAGLNALYASAEYLEKSARVLLIDEKSAAGGMWNTAYDYVRLHQPHPMFTVGDMKWDWQKPNDYLARRDEVRNHLASALEPVGNSVALETAFAERVTGVKEVATEDGFRAQVSVHPVSYPEKARTIMARRAIYAPGLDYRSAAPLPLSSSDVISIIPQQLNQSLTDHPDAPLIVVGGGKTGMDTVLAALAQNPKRRVSLIKGRGTNFFNRTKYIPTGFKRWTSGQLVSGVFCDIAHHFDGGNEDAVIDYIRRTYATDPGTENGVFLYGLQSEHERDQINAGLTESIAGYLEDIANSDAGPQARLRDGTTFDVAPGSIVVNCSGSFFRGEDLAGEMPLLSPHRTVLSINARDGFHFLTSVSGFFLPHLLNREALQGAGFYRLDHEALFRQNRNAWVGASAAQAYLNQLIGLQVLPMMLLDKCGLDLDRWYPLPRRMAGLIRMKSNAKAGIAHCRTVLDRVSDRFGVRCGPIE